MREARIELSAQLSSYLVAWLANLHREFRPPVVLPAQVHPFRPEQQAGVSVSQFVESMPSDASIFKPVSTTVTT